VALDPNQQAALIDRLDRVRNESFDWGWGVGDALDELMAVYGFDK